MTSKTIEDRIVRYGDLRPCKTAFIDAHTPGSDQKENFTIIGGGVSESPDQHVHISIPHGFNIGAAGQPPKCRNSMHNHRTAEVFFVLSGRWRFFWGEKGDAGEVILEKGDIFNIPTNIFRGFENIGTDYGMIMAILGGDDAGGGVIWAPHVIEDAKQHGLVLGENGKLYDTKKGEKLPKDIKPMPLLTPEELSQVDCPNAHQVIKGYVRRYLDLASLANEQVVNVIGENGLIRDKPGFEINFFTRKNASQAAGSFKKPSVLMPVHGHWYVKWAGGSATLAPGDTMSVPEDLTHNIEPAMSGDASIYQVVSTNDPAGATWIPGS